MDDMMETVPEAINCTFVGEGRANVVFTLTNIDGHSVFQGTRLFSSSEFAFIGSHNTQASYFAYPNIIIKLCHIATCRSTGRLRCPLSLRPTSLFSKDW